MATRTITNTKTTTPQPPLTLHLRGRRKQPKRIWRFDWAGLEHKREETHKLAEQIQKATDDLEAECNNKGWQAAGAIMMAIRDPDEAERVFSP